MPTRVEGAVMMATALVLLIVPGIVINNLTNSGVITPAASSCPSGSTLESGLCLTCDSSTTTCVAIAPPGGTGCSATPPPGGNPLGNCALEGSAISFLNACSPWTGLLTLNFLAFVSSFFSNCGKQSSQLGPNPAPFSNETFTGCSLKFHTATNGQPDPTEPYALCTTVTPPITSTAVPFTGPFYLTTCPTAFPSGFCNIGQPTWDGIVGNTTVGSVASPAKTFLLDSSAPVQNAWEGPALFYGNYYGVPYNGLGWNGTISRVVIYNFTAPPPIAGGAAVDAASIFGFFLSLFGITLVVILSLGIGVAVGGSVFATGTSGSFWSNPQGTKLAQVFGIGLVIWTPLYSEFSTWFASGYMPYGLDGTVGIISLALTALFGFGLYILNSGGGTSATSQAKT